MSDDDEDTLGRPRSVKFNDNEAQADESENMTQVRHTSYQSTQAIRAHIFFYSENVVLSSDTSYLNSFYKNMAQVRHKSYQSTFFISRKYGSNLARKLSHTSYQSTFCISRKCGSRSDKLPKHLLRKYV